jgi:hypothetical protein
MGSDGFDAAVAAGRSLTYEDGIDTLRRWLAPHG